MDDKIVDLFGDTSTPVSDEPVYSYTISFKDDTPDMEAIGYIVMNQLFYGVARGEGILYYVWPTENIKQVINNGPVSNTVN